MASVSPRDPNALSQNPPSVIKTEGQQPQQQQQSLGGSATTTGGATVSSGTTPNANLTAANTAANAQGGASLSLKPINPTQVLEASNLGTSPVGGQAGGVMRSPHSATMGGAFGVPEKIDETSEPD